MEFCRNTNRLQDISSGSQILPSCLYWGRSAEVVPAYPPSIALNSMALKIKEENSLVFLDAKIHQKNAFRSIKVLGKNI